MWLSKVNGKVTNKTKNLKTTKIINSQKINNLSLFFCTKGNSEGGDLSLFLILTKNKLI